MTDDKKIRDLIARMVSMSPEPPPYPEEITMAKPSPTRRRSPALIFAVAAAAVVVLALPLFLWDGGGGSPVGGDTTTTTALPPTTAPDTETTAPTLPSGTVGFPVFVAQDPTNTPSGNPGLVPVWIWVDYEDAEALEQLQSHILMLLNHGEAGGALPEGMTSYLPDGLEVSEGQAPGLITLDFNEVFLDGAGGLLADITMLNQLVYTATVSDPSAKVLFTVGGSPVEAFGTDGISLLEPVGRDDFLDHLNPILVTEPVEVTDNGVRVVGKANVFEAVVSYRVPGTDIEGFSMATCGTGCWGDFVITFPADGLPEGSVVEVYSASAEDGSPMFLISVPIG
jgi:hypothetical protein